MNTDEHRFSRLLLPFYFLLFTCLSFAQTGKDAQWATAGKQGVGTSASLQSKVWFTLAQGVMTEVYYPDLVTANVHLLQFIVVNPKTKKVETEQDDAVHQIKVTRPDSLSFQQINTAKSGEWTITKSYTTDIERDSVLINVQFQTKNKNLNLYVYYDPSLGNSGMGDSTGTNYKWEETDPSFLRSTQVFIAKDKTFPATSALKISSSLTEQTNGFYQDNTGFEELKSKGKIKNINSQAVDGNVVQIAKIKSPEKFFVTLSFGKTDVEAAQNAILSWKKGFAKCQAEYEKDWSDYVKTLPKVDPKYQAQFNMSAMVLKAFEDKTNRGANIASLSMPWGGGLNANEVGSSGYHAVWARDLYQVATAFMALGDKDAANRALDFLFKFQQKSDGSFPQNSWLDGKPIGGSIQLDEVAFPLILAHEIGRFDKETYQKNIKSAADFIVKNGPVTQQERWEEKSGYSPSTIAAEIAGLVCAAEVAKKNNDFDAVNRWLKTADDWQSNVEKWTVTTTGKHSKLPYYVRITQNGKPDNGDKFEINGVYGTVDERDIVDAGFLELVRLGIKSPDDKIIQNSIEVVDKIIKVSTPNGEGFYRYNFDSYGEPDTGQRWNFDGKYTGKGRLWALLSGERGQYELALANSKFQIPNSKLPNPKVRLDSMLAFANEGLMIPEQIWDSASIPKNIDKQFVPELKFGEGTGSATPLAWSMAQFIRLAVNLKAGRNLDTPKVVYDRYVSGKKDFVADADFYEIPESFQSGFDNRCFDGKPFYKKDCSYTSTVVNKSEKNPIIRPCRLVGFYFGCGFPNQMHACFSFQSEYKNLEIIGDFTDWKPVALKLRKRSDGFEAECFNFDKSARIEYKLIVDGKSITDPLNPNKVADGKGGENSFFTMPDYKPAKNQ